MNNKKDREIKLTTLKILMALSLCLLHTHLAFSNEDNDDNFVPLSIEEFTTKKGRVRASLMFTYANSQDRNISISETNVIQTGPTSFVTTPGVINESSVISDFYLGTLTLRYGVSQKFELYNRTSYQGFNIKTQDASTSGSDLIESWLGISMNLKKENAYPGITCFLEGAIHEKFSALNISANGKAFSSGCSFYKTIDPIVMTLSAGYKENGTINEQNITIKRGDQIFITPGLLFAVNDQITISSEVSWTNQKESRLNNNIQNINQSNLLTKLGVSYSLNEKSYFTFKTSLGGSNQNAVSLNWVHDF